MTLLSHFQSLCCFQTRIKVWMLIVQSGRLIQSILISEGEAGNPEHHSPVAGVWTNGDGRRPLPMLLWPCFTKNRESTESPSVRPPPCRRRGLLLIPPGPLTVFIYDGHLLKVWARRIGLDRRFGAEKHPHTNNKTARSSIFRVALAASRHRLGRHCFSGHPRPRLSLL